MTDERSDTLPLFLMEPFYRKVVWGGTRISQLKEVVLDDNLIGESWEVSDMPDAESKVADSIEGYAGMTVHQLMEQHAQAILGKRLHHIFGDTFPLLVKIIDAREDLSIQVHPDDYIASKRHGSFGKTELWYTLDAAHDAYIYSGLKEPSSPDELRRHIGNGTVTDLLARFTPGHGDFFYLPAGRIHSIGAGTMVLEIQQPSDITYRIFDYNRPGLDGKLRQLHVDEALEAIDFRVHSDYKQHIDASDGREYVLQECPHFTATIIRTGSRPYTLDVARYLSFRVLVATAGSGVVSDDAGHSVHLRRGHTLIVPATTPRVLITPDANCESLELVTAYIQ